MENDARIYCARLGQLKSARALHESHWAECYRYGAPERQQSFSGSDVKNQRETERADSAWQKLQNMLKQARAINGQERPAQDFAADYTPNLMGVRY
ncbi:hypothetical protein ACIN8IBEIGE_70043 [Acinetobacter sp. 8I-beige]|uniref:hypothetical protein n=1 Tax=Acinetobacter sp. 8I-beige TaxID=2653125 RepID=UPI0012EF62F4|nr:hypothetical protein [Acinetobacter sp. 8I-beige]VXA88254.1 hypothetical protein ACIN8IBEIGE_70043 [Acinetobacter sp. 8I-beige]